MKVMQHAQNIEEFSLHILKTIESTENDINNYILAVDEKTASLRKQKELYDKELYEVQGKLNEIKTKFPDLECTFDLLKIYIDFVQILIRKSKEIKENGHVEINN